MCADRAVNSSGTAHCQVRKIAEINGWLFGAAGAAAEMPIIAGFIRAKLDKGELPTGLLGKTGYVEEEQRQTGILVNPSGQIHVLDRDKDGNIFCYAVDALFGATGSGRDVALGAMAAGASAQEAVKIASRFDMGTGATADHIFLRALSPDQSGLGSLEGPFANQQGTDEPLAVPSSSERAEQEIPEGFTKWEGGEEPPISDQTPIEVMMRDGRIESSPASFFCGNHPSEPHLWRHQHDEDDIIAYRVIPSICDDAQNDETHTHASASHTEASGTSAGEPERDVVRVDQPNQAFIEEADRALRQTPEEVS